MRLLLAPTSKILFWSHLKSYLYIVVLLSSFLGVAMADTEASDAVVLTIYGDLINQEDGKAVNSLQFNMASLVEMDATSFTSSAPWTQKPVEYTGVRINILLKHIGALSNRFEAIADNNYKFALTDIDFDKYPVIIAYKKNAEFFSARELGPLLIMFPFDDFPELVTEKNKASAVWQLIELQML